MQTDLIICSVNAGPMEIELKVNEHSFQTYIH